MTNLSFQNETSLMRNILNSETHSQHFMNAVDFEEILEYITEHYQFTKEQIEYVKRYYFKNHFLKLTATENL